MHYFMSKQTQTLPQQTHPLLNPGALSLPAGASPAAVEALVELESVLHQLSGYRIRVAPVAAWDRFLVLPETTQAEMIRGWKAQTEFIRGALDEGLDALDEVGMLRYALGRLGLFGEATFSEDIEPGDIIEVADSDCVQIYRSFSYFALCNYSILELSTYPWYELYERPSAITDLLMQAAKPLLEGQKSRIQFSHIPEYSLRELLTEECAVFTMREKFAQRLISNLNGKSYCLSVKSVKELEALQRDRIVYF